MNHEQIKAKIDAIPTICAEGKKAVANLLKEFGYVEPVPKPARRPKPGEIWNSSGATVVIGGTIENPTYRYVSFTRAGLEIRFDSADYDYWNVENWQYVGPVTDFLTDYVKDLKKVR
jgi:hypothetical protein